MPFVPRSFSSPNDNGHGDTHDTLGQSTKFHDVEEFGDLTALNHDWYHLDFHRDTQEPGNARDWHYDYTSGSSTTKTANGNLTTVGSYVENWNDHVHTDETVHEHLRRDRDKLVNATMPAPYNPPSGYYYTQHQTEFYESDTTNGKVGDWVISGSSQRTKAADGTIADTFVGSSGTVTTTTTYMGWSQWASDFTNTSGSTNDPLTTVGPVVEATTSVLAPWITAPRNYGSPTVFPGDPSNRPNSAGMMFGAKYVTPTYGTLETWQGPDLPFLHELVTYYTTFNPTDVSTTPASALLPARPAVNGHSEETGGPQWAAERDGAELVQNVEHIRGIERASIDGDILGKATLHGEGFNPWTGYANPYGGTIWAYRIIALHEAVEQLSSGFPVTIPQSEIEQFDDALRSDYQSEDTAKLIEQRDRSDTMPPRTVADASTQISGWLAEVAMSHGHLTVNNDTGRKADSGKYEDGGEVEAEKLETVYQQDEPSGGTGNLTGGGNGAVNTALTQHISPEVDKSEGLTDRHTEVSTINQDLEKSPREEPVDEIVETSKDPSVALLKLWKLQQDYTRAFSEVARLRKLVKDTSGWLWNSANHDLYVKFLKNAESHLDRIKAELEIANGQQINPQFPTDREFTKEEKELIKDLVGFGLDIAGLFDPTPISDGSSALFSLWRGNYREAALNGVAMLIPYLGDLAKLPKVAKYIEKAQAAIKLFKESPAFAKVAKPILVNISAGIGKLNNVDLGKFPDAVRPAVQKLQETLAPLKKQIDEALSDIRLPKFPKGIDPIEGNRLADSIRRSLNIEGRNIALAEATLEGGAPRWLVGVSGQASPAGTVAASSTPLFKTVPSGAQTRAFDSEVKILEDIAQGLSRDTKGTISFFTERLPCRSCRLVKEQFEAMFPNITLIITHGSR